MPDLTPANSHFPLVANQACPDKGAKWSVFLKGHNIRMAEMRSAMEIAREKARKKRLSQRNQLKIQVMMSNCLQTKKNPRYTLG